MDHNMLRRVFLDRLKLVGIATAVVALIRVFVADVVVVDGCSMQPALEPGERLLVEKVTPRLGRLTQGDIVVLAVGSAKALMVKRIVAMEGDRVSLQSGTVIVNGVAPPSEEQAIPDTDEEWGPRTVPPGTLFVLGDNRPQSVDGVHFGPVKADAVRGRVVGRVSHLAMAVARLGALSTRRTSSADAHHIETHAPGPTSMLGHALGGMAEVQTAYVVTGERRVWLCRDQGIREDTGDDHVIFRLDGVWHYNSAKKTLVISPPTSLGWETRMRMHELLGLNWLKAMSDDGSEHTYTVSDDTLRGRPTARFDVLPDQGRYGSAIWIDKERRRVVRVEEFLFEPVTRRPIRRTVEISYETPMDPDVFSLTVPGDVVVDDRRGEQRPARAGSRVRHG